MRTPRPVWARPARNSRTIRLEGARTRASKVARLVILLGTLVAATGLSTSPALAECVNQANFFPKFTKVAPTAKRIIVGTVGRDQNGHYPTSPVFDFHVDEVLRGTSPSDIRIFALRSGLPPRGAAGCFRDAHVYARTGDVIALAFDGRLPGFARRVTTVAWIEGMPDEFAMQHVQKLSLEEVRRIAALPDTSTTTPDDSGRNASGFLLGSAVLGLTAGLALSRRKRWREERGLT